MFRIVLAIAILLLSGCSTADLDLTCDELAALQPSSYPLDPIMQGSDREIAGRLADAVGDPIVGPEQEHGTYVRSWNTTHGSASVTYGGGQVIYAGYARESELTKDDGSEMLADLQTFMEQAGADISEYTFEGPMEGDSDGSLAVHATKGAKNSWWRMQIHDGHQGLGISKLRDPVDDMADDLIGAYGLAHARCLLLDQNETAHASLDRIHDSTFWFGDAPGRYVDIKTPSCGGYVIVDTVTGANLEAAVTDHCPDHET